MSEPVPSCLNCVKADINCGQSIVSLFVFAILHDAASKRWQGQTGAVARTRGRGSTEERHGQAER
eukprot:6040029-Prymnesium_polylepis.1